jgi:hypothetical protein
VATADRIGSRGVPILDQLAEGGTMDTSTSRDLVEAMAEIVEERPQDAFGAAMHNAFVRHSTATSTSTASTRGVGGLEAFLQQRVRNVVSADR